MKAIPVLVLLTMFAGEGAWARDRGFKIGQTLPDISLIDLEGKEVRFSEFLGKQYILYGWASW